ncbi:tripartite tricarboxylate transporter substrate binding protein [Achromobacter sp. GG226]|uniref:Bug family tripartite tricarboxylate transporter substrate binding protein n=1 Tax=Verticiella alkaliphila TaxID=2779529 RepID=UPI001C0BE581|nr:tripartite tricarboxylate transporter substrate binding protein [Verticiella sp. GG226]MBU4611533.1 tripartite tricarboxylate transporter substrate binding protein [Verticiella sp. GG226]
MAHCFATQHHRARRVALVAFAATAALATGIGAAPALAAEWPTRPLTLIVPFGAGGTTDVLARLVAEGLGKELGQQVIVDNKPGAGANIGASEVARAKPDGYTLLMGTPGPLAINPYIYKQMSFDPAKDFTAVSYVADVPNVIVTNPASGLKTIQDLLDRARAEPGKLNWGSPGVGSTGHIQLELLKQLTGVDISHVPYKGAAQASADLMAGHIDLAGDNVPTALPHIRSERLLALGVASEKELEVLPGVQPVGATVPGYVLPSWFVIVAPAETPGAITERIAAAIDAFAKQPQAIEKFRALGAVHVGGPPSRLAEHLTSEQARYGEVLKDLKATVQ